MIRCPHTNKEVNVRAEVNFMNGPLPTNFSIAGGGMPEVKGQINDNDVTEVRQALKTNTTISEFLQRREYMMALTQIIWPPLRMVGRDCVYSIYRIYRVATPHKFYSLCSNPDWALCRGEWSQDDKADKVQETIEMKTKSFFDIARTAVSDVLTDRGGKKVVKYELSQETNVYLPVPTKN